MNITKQIGIVIIERRVAPKIPQALALIHNPWAGVGISTISNNIGTSTTAGLRTLYLD
jgi:hypothetical protein